MIIFPRGCILSEILWIPTGTGVWFSIIGMVKCPRKKSLRLPGTLNISKSHKAEHDFVDLLIAHGLESYKCVPSKEKQQVWYQDMS